MFTAEDGLLTIDEIKSTTLPLEKLAVQQAQHLGQAQCYAYMLLQTLDAPPETVGVQLTYYQLETEELQRPAVCLQPGGDRRLFRGSPPALWRLAAL